MGARVVRMFRNFNIENRALREISKEKKRAAPRHPGVPPPTLVSSDVVKQKNQQLLDLLQTVYVESTDPVSSGPAETSKEVNMKTASERRPVKFTFSINTSGLPELTDVPKGKMTLVEALRVLGNHKHQPYVWTPEKVSQELSLDLKDTKAFLEFFFPFKVEIVLPEGKTAKQIKD